MTENMNNIDWAKYSRQGFRSPDFVSLIQDLSSEDWLTRKKASGELYRQLEWAYEKVENELPFEIIPVFIELLQLGKLPDIAIITDLLLCLISYSEIKTLEEPYKSNALRLKSYVCQGIDTYKSLLDDEEAREDIILLLESCDDQKPDNQS